MFIFELFLFLSLILSTTYTQDINEVTTIECTEDDPCIDWSYFECTEDSASGPCNIICKGEEVCMDAQFYCPLDSDCTIFCDSLYGDRPCLGINIIASNANNMKLTVICHNYEACEYMTINTTNSIYY